MAKAKDKEVSASEAEMQKNALAPISESANALSTESVAAFDTGDNGYENVSAKDLLIPRLTILQGLSPQITQGKPEFDPTAKVGDIYDVGLQQRFPEGIMFLPIYYTRQYLEWAPRASGKGLQKIHSDEEILKEAQKDEKSGALFLPNGNLIVETAQLYGFNVTADNRKSFLPMASTQLKKARRLLTLATSEKLTRADGSQFSAPLFYRTYMLTTVPESNTSGSWMGWKIERGPKLEEMSGWKQIMSDIREFRDSLAAGTIAGDMSKIEEETNGQTIDNDSM